MIKKLVAVGNSLGLIIDRPILELLKIERDTPLEISTDGEALIIRPASGAHKSRVAGAAERMMDTHEDAFDKLAR